MRAFTRQLIPSIVAVVAFTVLVGLVYPLAVTAVAQVAFHNKANGSLIKQNGVVVGSKLIGQQFSAPQYFHPRPSSAGTGYDADNSAASNLGPTNPDFLKTIEERVAAYRQENGLAPGQLVPVDAVTGSGSGLDPEISVANAKLQAARVAKARGIPVDDVLKAIDAHTRPRQFGFLGEEGVNVLELNLALDGAK
jgi:K+-transporting ATPase ATPase C chain